MTNHVIIIACLLTLATPLRSAERSTSDDWTRLVIELRTQRQRLDSKDRDFLFHMLNVLTARDDAVPTAGQRKWLLDIEKRLKEKQ